MLRTEHNLRTLEKKVRQLLDLVDTLAERKAGAEGTRAGFEDLPLLRSLEAPRKENSRLTGLLQERQELRERIRRLREDIEKALG